MITIERFTDAHIADLQSQVRFDSVEGEKLFKALLESEQAAWKLVDHYQAEIVRLKQELIDLNLAAFEKSILQENSVVSELMKLNADLDRVIAGGDK